MITGLTIKDEVGQVTRVEFKNIQKNVEVASDIFKFDPPEGVDIIQNQQ